MDSRAHPPTPKFDSEESDDVFEADDDVEPDTYCTDCNEGIYNADDNAYTCGRCEETYCRTCTHSVEESKYPELFLTFDFFDVIFCKSCKSELPQDVADMSLEDQTKARAAYDKFQLEFKKMSRGKSWKKNVQRPRVK